MNAISLAATILLCVMVIVLPRRAAAIPLITGALYMTLGQKIVLVSFDFYILRIIIFFALLRVVVKRELYAFHWNALDKLIVTWVIVAVVTGVLLEKTTDAFINRMGFAYNVIGIYFFFRSVVWDLNDVDYILSRITILIFPLAMIMILENLSGKNIFSIFGGVPEMTAIREGRLRCQGPFGHPILAGTLGATFAPLIAGQWIRCKDFRTISTLGFLGAIAITFTSASSGPALAFLFGLIGLLMWPLNAHMQLIRRIIMVSAVLLHLFMKAPVWFVIARISDLVGGTGYHRSVLIDQAINHFDEWWLVGTTYTAHWMPYVLPSSPGYIDITNQYIAEGVTGGIGRMGLFIAILVCAFKNIGTGLRFQRETGNGYFFLLWSLGASLFSHMVSFISVSYFDQIIVFWYLLLAMIATIPSGVPAQFGTLCLSRHERECTTEWL